jgi:hypothetical protein
MRSSSRKSSPLDAELGALGGVAGEGDVGGGEDDGQRTDLGLG